MDKNLAGIIGAVAAIATPAAAHSAAAPPSIEAAMHFDSYADLLKPIPNAVALLRASDAEQSRSEGEAAVQLAQYRHHHHHHRYWRRWRRRYHHHHHHHHHASAFISSENA